MVDGILAVIAFLKSDVGVSAVAGDRIYGIEVPKAEIDNMPRQTTVIRASGGSQARDYIPVSTIRIDVFSYGETHSKAAALDLAIYDAMKSLRRTVTGSALIHNAESNAGPISLRDPTTNWPYMLRSCLVTLSDVTAS